MVLSNEITLSYYETQTDLTKTVSSKLGSGAPQDVEICNNSVDDDGDGLVDCEDNDCEECYYEIRTYSSSFKDEKGTFGFLKPVGYNYRVTSVMSALYINELPYTACDITNEFHFGPTVGQIVQGPRDCSELKEGWNYVTATTPNIESGDIMSLIAYWIFDTTSHSLDIEFETDSALSPKLFLTVKKA